MFAKILISIIVILVIFLAYVSTRDGDFRYERSGVIHAPAEKIFPYISDLKKGVEWSPYEIKDPKMKKKFVGSGSEPGSYEEFDGAKSGTGKIEILKVIPNQLVELRLTMLKPFRAENLVEYRLSPEGDGTRFTWIMSGNGGFIGKLVSTLIDCEKMVTKDFVEGIGNLKKTVEARN